MTPFGPRKTRGDLPDRLAMCLWDFSWYTRAGLGEPYADLERALDETAARGYNALRICAAPMLLYGGLDVGDLPEKLAIEGLGPRPDGDYYGRRTRWYDAPGGYTIDLRAQLFRLLAGARSRGMVVVLSSWEYQQSPAFAASPRWYEQLTAVPFERRTAALADAFDRMLADIRSAGISETVAFVELHNEVNFSLVEDVTPATWAAVASLRRRHPDQLITVSFGRPPHLSMYEIPEGLDVAEFHIYSYGVLDALQREIDIRETGTGGFPNAALRALQVKGAPTFAEYGRPAEWKLKATVVTDQMFYGYDTIDADGWDAWLYENYANYRPLMLREIESRVTGVIKWANWRGIPAVFGEGWVGYTPVEGTFEEGPAGRALAEHGVHLAKEMGAWGATPSSNAAPHHPMWADERWQRSVNEYFLD